VGVLPSSFFGLGNDGYGLGALANLSDALIGFNPQKVDLEL
jgi:hypothetical protein